MTARIVQQVSGRTRPLSFDANGSKTLVVESAATPWAGLQFEIHRAIVDVAWEIFQKEALP